MTSQIDPGPIAYESSFELAANATGLSVSAECVRRGLPLLGELISTAQEDDGAIPRRAQELARRRYFGREVPYGGVLPWSEPAQRIVAFTRACDFGPFRSPGGRPRTRSHRLGGRELRILQARATGLPSSEPAGPWSASPTERRS